LNQKCTIKGHDNSDSTCYNNELDSKKSALIFEKKIWRVGDVAKFLDCTVGHVYNLVSNGKIPKRKKYGLLFFLPDEILNWILEGDAT